MIGTMASYLREDRGAKRIAGVLAVIAWSGVVIQFFALLYNMRNQPHPILESADWFISFFTNLTNTLLAVVLTTMALDAGGSRWKQRIAPSLAAASVVYIIVVGVIYFVLLRPKHGPSGLGMVADVIMHYVMPIGYPIFWMRFVRKCELKYAWSWYWIVYPLGYAALTEVRGGFTGWYPYGFLDAGRLGYPLVLVNAVGLTMLFELLGVAVVWVDRKLKVS
jgi:hypothetical protein